MPIAATSPFRACNATAGFHSLPTLIAQAGEHASRRFLEFFTASIRNRNTRAAYAKACSHFLT